MWGNHRHSSRIDAGFCGTQFVQQMVEYATNAERRRAMKMHYRFAELSKDEREFYEMILMEEVDVQAWYAITFSNIFGEEIFLTVQ